MVFRHLLRQRSGRPMGRQQGARLAVEQLETRQVLSTVGGPDARFIAEVYQEVLQRPVDPAGLSHWVGLLSQGVTRTEVALEIASGPEAHIRSIEQFYETCLGRSADGGGMIYCAQEMAAGVSGEQVEAQIAGSDEYFQVRGQGTTIGFLQALYQDVLGRPLDVIG